MVKIRNLLININLLNIVLFLICLYFAIYILFPTLSLKISYTLPSTKSVEEDISNEPLSSQRIPSMSEYASISDDNAFHPERKIPLEKKADDQTSQPPQPELVLYGTLITDDVSYAYLEDLKALRNTPGRGRRQITLKKGDSLGGFVLKEIETDKITMVRGDEKLIVEVRNTQRAKASHTPPSASTSSRQQPVTTPSRRTVPQVAHSPNPSSESSSRAVINPPRNAEEQTIMDFFDKTKKD